jgi:ATP-dependent Clp protease, protease subunit
MNIIYNTNLKTSFKALKDLIEDPLIIRVTDFNEESCEKFSEQMNRAVNSGQPLIPIVINSYGGYVDSLFAMLDMIDNCPVPVATICEGKAMSCGSVLLSCGAEGMRFCAPTSRVMIHEVSSGFYGKNSEIQADAQETNRLNKLLLERMAKNCGQPKNYFIDLVRKNNNLDLYLTPQQALKHNLVNHIDVPTMLINVQSSIEFVMKKK